MLYAFFWVIPWRLNFIFRHFGTLRSIFIGGKVKPSQAKVLTGGGDLREEQVDVPLSVSHSCV
jgi:hypothetical protein